MNLLKMMKKFAEMPYQDLFTIKKSQKNTLKFKESEQSEQTKK